MAKFVLKDSKLYYDAYDLSGDHNKMTLVLGGKDVDSTVFGCSSIARLAGMKSFDLSHAGFAEHGTGKVSKVLFDNLGTAARLLTVCPIAGADGERAYFSKAVSLSYEESGEIGGMYAFTAGAHSDGTKIVKGTILGTGAKTATANGVARELGAILATQYLYGAIHVTVASGSTPTLNVKIQSDDAEAFALPTDRMTFTQVVSTRTAEWATPIAGAITDTWWRAVWTITGTNPSYTLIVAMGIH